MKTSEYKVVAMRDLPLPDTMMKLDTPTMVAEYYNQIIKTSPQYREDVEQLIVLFLNTRRRCTGYQIVSTGTLDSVLAHPREVYRAAIINNSSAIVLLHNHPSLDSTPSEPDIKMTKVMKWAGELLKIELLDHIIMGAKYCSLRELGYFY